MKFLRQSFFVSLFLLISLFAQAQDMNNEKLEKILYVVSDTLQGQLGAWEFIVHGMPMMCLTDETHNRMRIITPVKEMKEVTPEEVQSAMEANFHTALDVKYAISNEVMWVAFIHPLSELSKEQVMDAISQVYNAHLTFGTTYSSTELVFPKKEGEEEKKEKEKKKKTKRS